MRSRFLVLFTALIVLSMVLTACQPAATAAPAAPAPVVPTPKTIVQTVVVQQPGQTTVITATPAPVQPVTFKSKDPTTFTDYTFGDVDNLDPALLYDTFSADVVFNTYDTLLMYKKDSFNDVVPMLATEVPSMANGDISADGMTYTFKIRSGVKFHNGDDLTPSAVAYSFQQGILSGGSISPQWLLSEPILGSTPNDDVTDQFTADDLKAAKVDSVMDDRDSLSKIAPDRLKAVCDLVQSKIVADDTAGTVTFKLAQPWGPFLDTLSGTSWGAIRDPKWVAANGGWDGDCTTWQKYYAPTSDETNKTLLGTGENGSGPYILVSWTPKDSLVYKANDSYWMKDPMWDGAPTGAPKIKNVVVKEVTEFSTRLAAFKAGDADMAAPGSAADWPQMDTLVGERCDATTLACQPDATNPTNPVRVFDKTQHIDRTDAFFNFKINITGGNNFIGSGKLDGNGIPANFFSDINVRKAFAYCFDWGTYIQDVMQGYGTQANDMFLLGMIGDSNSTPKYTYDPGKCTDAFKASKWTEGKDAQGNPTYTPDPKGTISLWDTGFRFSIGYNTGNTARQSVAQIWQQDVSSVNPKFVIEAVGLPWPTYLSNYQAKKMPFFIIGWQEDIPDPHNWAFTYAGNGGAYSSKQGMPADIQSQLSPLVQAGAKETDPTKRAAIYAQVNQIFYDNVPTVLLAQAQGKHFEQRWMHGWYDNPIYPDLWYYVLSKD
ncbi:MAG: ABC transporter substrate-binding protein [Anaerolineaceae bacterium]